MTQLCVYGSYKIPFHAPKRSMELFWLASPFFVQYYILSLYLLLLVSFFKSLWSGCVDSFSSFLRSLDAQGNIADYCPRGPLNDNTLDSFPFHRHRRIKPQFLASYFPVPFQLSHLNASYPWALFCSNSPTELKPNFFMEEEFVIVTELRISAHARHTHTHSPLHCTDAYPHTQIHKRDAKDCSKKVSSFFDVLYNLFSFLLRTNLK